MPPQAPSPKPQASAGRRIALFGGSFDPPHLGHVLCATYARAVGRVDRVWVLPVHRHPYGKDLAPWDQRWDLCAAAFGHLGFVELRDDERRNPDGRTYDLLHRLRAEHPGDRFALIGGTDTRDDLPNWYRGDELLAELDDVIAIPRRGFDDAHPAALPEISSTRVRECLAGGAEVSDMMPAAVLDLIRERGWYRA